jgi:Fe2+ or Zn2+ uptake regulation protein
MTDRVERLLADLREQGERITPARRAVVTILVDEHGHLSADDLVERVHRRVPVHRATIYRTLDTLERLGVVEHTHLGHGRAVYHLADELHHHLVCEECGAVVEAPAALLAPLARRLREREGFTLRPRHFALVGRCRACGGAGAPAATG